MCQSCHDFCVPCWMLQVRTATLKFVLLIVNDGTHKYCVPSLVPYLCGVTRENWQHTQHFVSAETIVVDLDENSLRFGEETAALPEVPGKKWMKLQSSLNDIAGHLFWETRGLEKEYKDFSHYPI